MKISSTAGKRSKHENIKGCTEEGLIVDGEMSCIGPGEGFYLRTQKNFLKKAEKVKVQRGEAKDWIQRSVVVVGWWFALVPEKDFTFGLRARFRYWWYAYSVAAYDGVGIVPGFRSSALFWCGRTWA